MSVPLVCLPGLLCTPAVWDDTLAAAGLSAHVPTLAASDRMEQIAEDVLHGSPERFVLAGHLTEASRPRWSLRLAIAC